MLGETPNASRSRYTVSFVSNPIRLSQSFTFFVFAHEHIVMWHVEWDRFRFVIRLPYRCARIWRPFWNAVFSSKAAKQQLDLFNARPISKSS